MKGLIALDIDGTITGKDKQIPSTVTDFLFSLHQEGWMIALITGRSYQFAIKAISFSFPYILATQNGANIFRMPEKEELLQHYLDSSILPYLNEIYQDIPESYLIYSDHTRGDICYYKQPEFSKEGLGYTKLLKALTPFPWKVFSTVDSLEISSFPLIKCFGTKKDMLKVQQRLHNIEVSTFVIQDPIDPSKYLCLISSKEANKGQAVRWLQWLSHRKSPVITAGNDMNDIPLLQAGTIAISFDDSPKELLEYADIIVPQNNGEGIIEGLKKAVSQC